jgi:hypothetical protein
MCIIYFASHTTCTHSHLLGAWNCGLNCPTDARHTFYLDNNGFECSTCVFLRGEELDPDVNPVEYYPPPPVFGNDQEVQGNDGGEFEEQGVSEEDQTTYSEGGYVMNGADREATYKALSDPDSLRSEWRAIPPAPQHYAYSPTPASTHHSTPFQHHVTAQQTDFSPIAHPETSDAYPTTPNNIHALSPQMTPGTAAHRNLVRDQLRNLAVQPRAQTPLMPAHVQAPMGQFHGPEGGYGFGPWMATAGPPGPPGWLQRPQ